MKKLEARFNIFFKDPTLLEKALTHSSYANEHQLDSNERLEFIGDAVLDLMIADYLMGALPHATEGEMTQTRAKFVNEKALAIYAKKANLDEFLRLGIGEEKSNGRQRPAILADAFEAFLGAIYLDQGLKAVQKVTDEIVIPEIKLPSEEYYRDYKSQLQEWVQSDKRELSYVLVKEEGPSHLKTFTIRVYMDEICMGEGIGSSKKEAEQSAAKEALEKMVTAHDQTHL
jgi:ribonuclease III